MLLFLALIGLVVIIFLIILVIGLIINRKYKSNTTSQTTSISQDNITPLRINDNSQDDYSIKLTNRNTGLVTVYSGHFVSDFPSRSICLQRVFMELIEMTIQESIAPAFRIGALPNLGRPYNVVLKPKDILVSFPDKGDYLIFGEDLSVSFYSVETPVEIYNHGMEYNFVSSYYNITYSGIYDIYGEFTLNMSDGNNSTLNNNSLTFNNLSIPKQILSNGIILYKGSKIFVTVLPNVLPIDITVAGFVPGIFSSKKVQVTFERVYNYILDQYLFTASQKNKLMRLLKGLYSPMQYSIRHGIEFKDRYTHSSNNGFASIAYNDDTILEIRLS